MAFSDLQTKCWTGVLSGPASTVVDYKSRPDVGTEGNWVLAIPASVYQGNREEPSDWNMVSQMGQLPIYVSLRKASISSLRVGRDWVRWNNVVYVIKAIATDDGVLMELFCAK